MGNKSSSEVTQIVNQKVINKNDLESINEQVTKSTTENIMRSTTTSIAGSTKTAEIDIEGISAHGPGSTVSGVNLTIDQEALIDLEVTDKSIQENDINTELALAIINNVSSSITNDQMTKLVSAAESKQSVAGLALTGGNSTSSKVNTKMNTESINETKRKFINIVTNVIEQKAETENVKKCISSDIQNAIIRVRKGIVATDGGTVTDINITIKQASDMIAKCIFETQMTAKVTTAIAQAVGMTIVDETKNIQRSEGEATAKSSQTITGIFDLGSILALVVIAIILSIVAYVFMKAKGGGKSK
jgi:hypothetical protein